MAAGAQQAESGECRLRRGRDPFDLDHADEVGEVEEAAHRRPAAAQGEVATLPAGLAGGDRQHLQRRDVTGADVAEVDDDVLVVTLEVVVDGLADLPGAAHVEVAAEHEPRPVSRDVHRLAAPPGPRETPASRCR